MGLLAVSVACGNVANEPADAPVSPDSPIPVDAPPAARCDPSKPFGTPTPVANVNTSNDEMAFSMTRDELGAFIGYVVQPPALSGRILTTHRMSLGDELATPAPGPAAPLDLMGEEYSPNSVADGLLLYFHRQSAAVIDVRVASRPDRMTSYSNETQVTVDGTGLSPALGPKISADAQTLYWVDYNDFKVRAATRGSTPSAFVNARVASTMSVGNPVLSADELTMFYANGNGDDVFVTTRTSRMTPFGPGAPLDNVNTADKEYPVHLTHDGCVLVLASTRSGGLGGFDLWKARRGS